MCHTPNEQMAKQPSNFTKCHTPKIYALERSKLSYEVTSEKNYTRAVKRLTYLNAHFVCYNYYFSIYLCSICR